MVVENGDELLRSVQEGEGVQGRAVLEERVEPVIALYGHNLELVEVRKV